MRRYHVAVLRGKSVGFWSRNSERFWLESDAIQACKEAGLYERDGDDRLIRLDGEPIRREY